MEQTDRSQRGRGWEELEEIGQRTYTHTYIGGEGRVGGAKGEKIWDIYNSINNKKRKSYIQKEKKEKDQLSAFWLRSSIGKS